MTAIEERFSPRVLCIAGSPRRGGNSDSLLDALEDGVREAGGVPVRLIASAAGVAPCRGCNSCSRDGRCIQRDGMDDVYRAIDEADAFAVASPVYFASVPAVLKIILDRCQPYWARRFVLHEPIAEQRRPGAVLVVGGGGDPYGVQCAVTPIRSVFAVLGVACEEVLEVVGPDRPGDVIADAGSLERARDIGAMLVSRARNTTPCD